MHSVGLLAYGETGLTPLTNGGSPLLRNVCFLASSSQHALRGTTTVNQYIGEVGAKIESRETLQSQFLRGPMLLAGRQQADSKSRVPRMPMYDPLSRPRNSRLVAVSPLPSHAKHRLPRCVPCSCSPWRRLPGRVTQSPLDDNACIGQVHPATFPHGPSFQPRLHIESPKRHGVYHRDKKALKITVT